MIRSPHSDGSVLFTSLPKWKTPWHEFAVSYGAQAIIIALAVWISLLHPAIMEGPKKDYHAMELVPTPVPEEHLVDRHVIDDDLVRFGRNSWSNSNGRRLSGSPSYKKCKC